MPTILKRFRAERKQANAARAITRKKVISATLRAKRDEAIRFARARERLKTQRRIQIRKRVLGIRKTETASRRTRRVGAKRIKKRSRRTFRTTRNRFLDAFG